MLPVSCYYGDQHNWKSNVVICSLEEHTDDGKYQMRNVYGYIIKYTKLHAGYIRKCLLFQSSTLREAKVCSMSGFSGNAESQNSTSLTAVRKTECCYHVVHLLFNLSFRFVLLFNTLQIQSHVNKNKTQAGTS